MIDPRFLHLLFSTSSIERWNDQVRPVEFSELDKQAHKTIIAWLLANVEAHETGKTVDWTKLIDYGIVEFAYRAVVTDLKPPVFHYLYEKKRKELDAYVREVLEPLVDRRFMRVFDEYVESDGTSIERRILGASHYLASRWEFDIIHDFRPEAHGVGEIKEKIDSEVEEYLDLTGVRRLEMGRKSRDFLELCAMLRFQKRWAKTPRLPQTSVLGHMLFVSVVTWLLSLEYGAGERKRVNNFYAALFHDIAEALTRDIISPVKYGVEGLDGILAAYEKRVVEERLLPLLPSYMRERMRYYVIDEFDDKVRKGGAVVKVKNPKKMRGKYNLDEYDGIDGSLMKVADHIGAYIEASASIANGVKPKHLEEARKSLRKKYKHFEIYGLKIGKLLKSL